MAVAMLKGVTREYLDGPTTGVANHIGWHSAIRMGRQSSGLIALTLIRASGGPNTAPYGRCVVPAVCWGTDAMLTVLACVFIPLGAIWLVVVSSSFRKAATGSGRSNHGSRYW